MRVRGGGRGLVEDFACTPMAVLVELGFPGEWGISGAAGLMAFDMLEGSMTEALGLVGSCNANVVVRGETLVGVKLVVAAPFL